jgi:hypothetical protein
MRGLAGCSNLRARMLLHSMQTGSFYCLLLARLAIAVQQLLAVDPPGVPLAWRKRFEQPQGPHVLAGR